MEESRRSPKKVQEGPRFSLVRFIIYWNPNVIATGPFGAPPDGTSGCHNPPVVVIFCITINTVVSGSEPSPAAAKRPRETASKLQKEACGNFLAVAERRITRDTKNDYYPGY